MAVTWLAILIFVLLFPVLMVVALLVSKRTRRVALAILGVLAVAVGIVVFIVFLMAEQRSGHRVVRMRQIPAASRQYSRPVGARQAAAVRRQLDKATREVEAMRQELEARAKELAEAIPRGPGDMPYDIVVSPVNEDGDQQDDEAGDEEPGDGEAGDEVAGDDETGDEETGDVAVDGINDAVATQDSSDGEPVAAGEVIGPETTLTTGSEDGTSAPAPAQSPQQDRPAWVETSAKRVGDVYQVAVVSDLYSTKRECDKEIDRLITIATAEYLDELLGERQHTRSYAFSRSPQYDRARYRLSRLRITPLFIRQNICTGEFDEIVESSVGPMHKVHVRMEFDKEVEIALRDKWKERELGQRLEMLGIGAAMILGLLGVVFAYLKFDTVTKGFYTRRLQVAAAVVTIIVILIIATNS